MSTTAPIKVTDLVQKSLDELAHANSASGELAAQHERKAHIYQGLAGAQSAKTANIIAYLNSDRSTWSVTDEEVVRIMLGLPSHSGDATAGGSGQENTPEPESPTAPSAAMVESAPADMEDLPEPDLVEEPSFA